jgi:hypothetical protein
MARYSDEFPGRGSKDQRLALLRGLMDADGHSLDRAAWVEIVTMSHQLAEGIAELARPLGQNVFLSQDHAQINGRVVGDRYRLQWRPTINPFRLRRKADRVSLDILPRLKS